MSYAVPPSSTKSTVVLQSLAKINLDLRVFGKRPDGYHEIRSILQTISLADRIAIEFAPQKKLQITLSDRLDIPDNLVLRAARAVCERLRIRGSIHIRLEKKIPMGAGLGGGSSNAAAVLRALPTLAAKEVDTPVLAELAAELGSDVPFFLFGGSALVLGRGAELYPLLDQPARTVLIVCPPVHVSTAEAYRALDRERATDVTDALTLGGGMPILGEFQSLAWSISQTDLSALPVRNDFEEPVFRMHPQLAAITRKLRRFGASPARMTGSGSALFGIFENRSYAEAAASGFPDCKTFVSQFVSRTRLEKIWAKALGS